MVDRVEVTWEVAVSAQQDVSALRAELGEAEYRATVRALQAYLAGYFTADDGCRGKAGKTVAPLGATARGAKALKVRWALPGSGKSGGVRLAIAAYCDAKRVVVAGVFRRRDDPGDEDFERAFGSAEERR